MAVFLVVPTLSADPVAAAIRARFADKSYQLPKGEWLISYAGTSRQLSDELGITDGSTASSLIVSVSGYYGRAQNDIWEWISKHWGT